MSNRTLLGKTKQYSDLSRNVQKSQQPEEPNITPEQVIAAFRSFGFEPNQRNENDIQYWILQPQSEGKKLIDELRKRRMEINTKEDETAKTQEAIHKSKQTLPRLSDNEISDLYDEYGLSSPDPEWARNHLPNDPVKIRSILETQRKTTDDMIKKHSKNSVNSVPEVPKMMAGMAQSTPASIPAPNMGMGGPGIPSETMSPSSPFFIGDHSIVKITNPNNPNSGSLFLVDAKKKVLRPFMSEQAFQNAFDDPQMAQESVITLSAKELGPNGILTGFKPLGAQYGIKDDGSMDEVDFSPAQLQKHYGQPSNPEGENKALSMLDGVFGQLKEGKNAPQEETLNNNPMGQGGPFDGQGGPESDISNPYGIAQRNTGLENFGMQEVRGAGTLGVKSEQISQGFVDSVMSDPDKLAMFVNAVTYGGYTIGDIINEIKRLEMIKNGDTNVSSFKIINPEIKRSAYLNTAEGAKATAGVRQYIPTVSLTGNLNPEILKYGINMPDDAFRILVPIMDVNSQTFKDEVNKVKSAYYDLGMQQLQATNEQEKTAADTEMTKFKEAINRKYGISLSDNANTAWKQMESLGDAYSQKGIQGSGMQNEAIDNYLRAVRNKDIQNRESKLTEEETQKASYYKSSASAAEIVALTPEDKAKYGLVPSADLLAKYDLNSLKQRFPDQSEEELKAYRDTILDENGNFRSTLYSKYYGDLNKTTQQKKTLATTNVLQKSLNEDDRARRIYDAADTFSSTTKADDEAARKLAESQKKPIVQEQTPEQRNATYAAAGVTPPLGKPEIIGIQGQTPTPIESATPVKPVIPQEQLNKISQSLSGIQSKIAKEGITDVSGKVLQAPTIPLGPQNKPNVYAGGSIVDYLGSMGQTSDINTRAKLAKEKGLTYDIKATGVTSANQNTALLKKLRGY